MRHKTGLVVGFVLAGCASFPDETANDVGSSTSATTSAEKRIVISLASQRARAYEGERCIRELPISTGKVYAGGNFDTTLHAGAHIYDFPILSKATSVRMRSPFPGVHYDSIVLNAIQLTSWGIYLHEADWTRTGPAESEVTTGDCGHCGNTDYAPHGFSHGCINERHADAVWLYDWAPAPNPEKNVVHVTPDAFAAEPCDVSTTEPDPTATTERVTDITYEACHTHPTHCLEDLQDASGAFDGRWICWRSGAHSTSGRLCNDGNWER